MGKTKYPKNKKHFIKLLSLAKSVISLCKRAKTKPIIYGSFSHFYHTRDKKMKINDIDLLIKEKDFFKIPKILEKNKIKFSFYPAGIIVKKGKLKVEIDKMEKQFNTKKKEGFFKNLVIIDFYGVKCHTLSLKQLEKIYLAGDIIEEEDKMRMDRKIKHLEEFLGRNLK